LLSEIAVTDSGIEEPARTLVQYVVEEDVRQAAQIYAIQTNPTQLTPESLARAIAWAEGREK